MLRPILLLLPALAVVASAAVAFDEDAVDSNDEFELEWEQEDTDFDLDLELERRPRNVGRRVKRLALNVLNNVIKVDKNEGLVKEAMDQVLRVGKRLEEEMARSNVFLGDNDDLDLEELEGDDELDEDDKKFNPGKRLKKLARRLETKEFQLVLDEDEFLDAAEQLMGIGVLLEQEEDSFFLPEGNEQLDDKRAAKKKKVAKQLKTLSKVVKKTEKKAKKQVDTFSSATKDINKIAEKLNKSGAEELSQNGELEAAGQEQLEDVKRFRRRAAKRVRYANAIIESNTVLVKSQLKSVKNDAKRVAAISKKMNN